MPTLDKIFEKAFAHTLGNGYEPIPDHELTMFSVRIQNNLGSYINLTLKTPDDKKEKRFGILVGINDIIFDHTFLKALYGEGEYIPVGDNMFVAATGNEHFGAPPAAYRYHAQQLSLISTVKGRINYIGSTMPTPPKRSKKKVQA